MLTHRLCAPAWPALLATCCLLAAASAQTLRPIAYPQETTTGSSANDGNNAPFGQNTMGTTDEARVQILIPASRLPSTNGLIHALDIVSVFGGQLDYQRLDVTLSHLAANQLSPNLTANVPAPVRVLSRTNIKVTYTVNAWHQWTFDRPFPYVKGSNLVVQVQKVMALPKAAQHGMLVSVHRDDLPRAHMSIGQLNSGAANATQWTHFSPPLNMRLWFSSVPATMATMTVRSDQGGNYRFNFALGQQVTMTSHANPGDLFVNLVDFSGTGLLATSVSVPPILGDCHVNLLSPLLILAGGLASPAGTGITTFNLPSDWRLVGRRLAFQSVAGSPTSLLLTWTPAADAIIGW